MRFQVNKKADVTQTSAFAILSLENKLRFSRNSYGVVRFPFFT